MEFVGRLFWFFKEGVGIVLRRNSAFVVLGYLTFFLISFLGFFYFSV